MRPDTVSSSKRNRTILMIAYVFPPISYAGTFRSLRLVKYLSKIGYNISVLTLKEQSDLDNDYSLLKSVPNKVRVIRTRTIDIWRSYNKIRWRIKKLPFGNFLDHLINYLVYVFSTPDHMILWIPFAIWAGYRLSRKEKYDFIYTSSPPHSSQMIGWFLSKLTGAKWVADFRDPIVDDLDSASWDFLEKRIYIFLEEIILRRANVVVANTNILAEKLRKRYPNSCIVAIHNSFDEDDFREKCVRKYAKFTLSHIGSMYNTRKADIIFSAVNRLDKMGAIEHKNFQILFVGINNPELSKTAVKYGVEQYLKIMKKTNHTKALEIMKCSHMLLLIKGLGNNSEGQVPGKLYEYIAAKTPVLCIARKESEAAKIITLTRSGKVFDYNSKDAADFILGQYQLYLTNRKYYEGFDAWQIEKFSSKNMALRFKGIFT